jgi:hypothetical protein
MGLWQPEQEMPVAVAAWFDPRRPPDRRVICLKLLWNGEPRLIKQFDLYHQDRKGEALLHYFSVSDRQRHYKLRFDSQRLLWLVEGIYEPE